MPARVCLLILILTRGALGLTAAAEVDAHASVQNTVLMQVFARATVNNSNQGDCIDSSAVLDGEMIELPGQTFRAISFYTKPLTPNTAFWLNSNLFYSWCVGNYIEYGGYSAAGSFNAWYLNGTLWTSPSNTANSCPLTDWGGDLARAEWQHVYVEFAQDVSPTSVCLFGRHNYIQIFGHAVFGSLTTWSAELTATELQEDVAMTLDPSATGKMVNHYTAADIEPYRVVAGGSASTKTFILGEGVGTCTAPTMAPTSSPTGAPSPHLPSTAVGDPHVTNLIGASFDVNQQGEHVLLRTPFDESLPPQLEVRASMRPAAASPCGLWITEVVLGGEWVGGGEIRVHTSTQGSADDTADHFALLWRSAGAPVSRRWRPWAEFGKNAEEVLSSNVTVRPTFRAFQGAAAVRGRRIFEFLIGAAPTMDERLSIVVAQASRRAALDVQATRLGRLGVTRFGGLLGTEEPDPAVEELSPECAAHLRSSGETRHSGRERAVADSVGSSAQAALFSDPRGTETATTMTASW